MAGAGPTADVVMRSSRSHPAHAQAHHCSVAMSIFVASFSFQFRARRYLTSVASVMNARSSMEFCADGRDHHATEGWGKVKRYRGTEVCHVRSALASSPTAPWTKSDPPEPDPIPRHPPVGRFGSRDEVGDRPQSAGDGGLTTPPTSETKRTTACGVTATRRSSTFCCSSAVRLIRDEPGC